MQTLPSSIRTLTGRWLPAVAFVVLYILFDHSSYIYPLYGLNITPWNPSPALGLVFWLRYGNKAALPWFLALMAGEYMVRNLPAGWPMTLLLSAWLTLGYGAIGATLRRLFHGAGIFPSIFDTRQRLLTWLLVVLGGTLLNAAAYISLLHAVRLIPDGHWHQAFIRFAIGDMVGIVVSMPLIWMLASARSLAFLHRILLQWETAAYIVFTGLLLYLTLGFAQGSDFNHFYFLFLPIIWAAIRQGLYGAGLIAFILQLGLVAIVKWIAITDIVIFELQMLCAVLTLVGYFIGIVVDEQRRAAEELKQTLRLAAAGDMTAALAHELNQPMTALSAYGKACEHLLAQGEPTHTSPILRDTIRKMIAESERAASVVRRLRDFFRTGAMQLEPIAAQDIITTIAAQFQPQFQRHGITFDIAPIPAVCVIADRLQIELVLRNLLANAQDSIVATPPGRRTITLSAHTLGGGRLRFSVEDSGMGVSDAIAARLFEPFVSSKSSGLGLGLVLSRVIVEAHGGSLWAEVGTHGIFRFILPLAESGDKIDHQ